MSRERISNYKVTVASGNVTVRIVKPSGITLATELTVEDENIGTYYLIYDSQESKWYVDGASPVVYYTTDDISTVHVGSNVYREVEGEPVGAGVVTAIGYTADSQRIVTEAVRLILDETALVVFCSSMKKALIGNITPSSEQGYDIAITFAIPSGKTVTATDAFTIEFDWALPMDFSALAKQGANPNATLSAILEALQGSGTPSPDIPESVAERLAMILEHFGIKTISGYEFMTDTEVTDELEDIMQAIDNELTPEQAASITAEAMQIINPSQS